MQYSFRSYIKFQYIEKCPRKDTQSQNIHIPPLDIFPRTKCSGCAEWVHEQAAGAVAYFSLSPHLVAQPPTWVALAPFLVQAGSQAAPTASRLSGKRWGKLARWPRTSQALQLTRKVVNLKQNTNLDKGKMKAK